MTAPATAKTGDEVTLTVTPGAGNAVTSITYNGTAITPTDGKYVFTMPGADVTIAAVFGEKTHDVTIDDAVKAYLSASDTKANPGETVTITVLDQAALDGKKLKSLSAEVYYENMGDPTSVEVLTLDANHSFVMPTGYSSVNYIYITAVFEDKGFAVTVDPTAKTNGNVTAPSRVDCGEKIPLSVIPNEGYKLKENSLKVKTEDGSVTATVPVTADAQGNFYYTLPTFTSATPIITVLAEFITDPDYTGPGTGAGAPKKTTISLGVGVTVAVTVHNNNAYIANGTIDGRFAPSQAASGSEKDKVLASAASKAEYSQGSIGIGGAFTVKRGVRQDPRCRLRHATVYLSARRRRFRYVLLLERRFHFGRRREFQQRLLHWRGRGHRGGRSGRGRRFRHRGRRRYDSRDGV